MNNIVRLHMVQLNMLPFDFVLDALIRYLAEHKGQVPLRWELHPDTMAGIKADPRAHLHLIQRGYYDSCLLGVTLTIDPIFHYPKLIEPSGKPWYL